VSPAGRLRGPQRSRRRSPQSNPDPPQSLPPQVACGQHHTLFLRRDGVAYGCGSSKFGQLPGNPARFSPDRTVALPAKMHFPFGDPPAAPPPQPAGGKQQQQAPAAPAPPPPPGGSSNGGARGAAAAASSNGGGPASYPLAPGAVRGGSRAPVVHLVVAGGNSSVFVTRGPDEIPEVYSINLLEK
jgi:hypothetical protein